MSKKEFPCKECGKVFKSRSGAWKCAKRCKAKADAEPALTISESPVVDESVEDSSSSVAIPHPPTDDDSSQGDTESKWMSFNIDVEEGESIPEALKLLNRPKPNNPKKMTAKEMESFKQTEIALLKMGLSGIDVILTQYGKGVTLDKEFEVRHSDGAKTTVASAQYAWLEEKGLSISKYASTGMIAASMTAWYVGSPIMRIKKNAQKPMIKRIGGGIGGFFRRLPLIGRIFGRKKKEEITIGQDVEMVE